MRLRQTDVSARAMQGETILLDLKSSRYLSVTGTGTRIVELLKEEHTLDGLVAVIADEYEVDPTTVRADTRRFVDRLAAAGLLES
jgi:Coenzyme PQQ synthesis protein D (PqqD)